MSTAICKVVFSGEKNTRKKCLKLNPSGVAWRVFVCRNRGEKSAKKIFALKNSSILNIEHQKGEKKDDI